MRTISSVGEKIKKKREKIGLTQTELAIMSGITGPGLSMIEKGKRMPNIKTFYAISKALSTTMDELYHEKDIFKEFVDTFEGDLKKRYDLCEDFKATPCSILLTILNSIHDVKEKVWK